MLFLKKLHQSLTLSKIDPLGGGLAEEIASERAEPEAIELEEMPNGEQLSEQWAQAVEELEHDPDWFHFADEE
ncbi:MAG: hypothetical protein JWM00_263 [Candidatus Saccharibacteria bacterium]|nr:hypothetical protein [Candidatus Saccharibacteria bacterium]